MGEFVLFPVQTDDQHEFTDHLSSEERSGQSERRGKPSVGSQPRCAIRGEEKLWNVRDHERPSCLT